MDNFNILVGSLIRKKRKEKGYCTKELADKLGISVGTLNNIENSRNDTLNLQLLLSIENVLHISILNLLYKYSNVENKKLTTLNDSSEILLNKLNKLNRDIYDLILSNNEDLEKMLKFLDKLIFEIDFYKNITNTNTGC